MTFSALLHRPSRASIAATAPSARARRFRFVPAFEFDLSDMSLDAGQIHDDLERDFSRGPHRSRQSA